MQQHEVLVKEKTNGGKVYLEVRVFLAERSFWGFGCADDEGQALALAIQNARSKAG